MDQSSIEMNNSVINIDISSEVYEESVKNFNDSSLTAEYIKLNEQMVELQYKMSIVSREMERKRMRSEIKILATELIEDKISELNVEICQVLPENISRYVYIENWLTVAYNELNFRQKIDWSAIY